MDDGDAHDELVLIVEDDPAIAELVQFVLEDEFGVQTAIAADGELGLELARRLHPVLVLLDVNLPKLSGLDVARRLKADPATQALALVAVTSTSEAETRKAGCSAHLAKPFELDDLTDVVGQYLGFAMPVPATANAEAAVTRLFAIKTSAVASAARNLSRSEELRAVARRTCLASRALSQRSTRLIQAANDRQQLSSPGQHG